MQTMLLHKDVFLPNQFKEDCKKLQRKLSNYFYSRHMEEHLTDLTPDRSHRYFNGDITREDINKLIESLSSTQREVFEVEITKGANGFYVTKYCCRIPFNNDQDFVVAIRPRYEKGGNILSMVVTGWLNHQEDAHYTLDESKYVSEKEYKKVV